MLFDNGSHVSDKYNFKSTKQIKALMNVECTSIRTPFSEQYSLTANIKRK